MCSSATCVVSARRREINELFHVVFCNLCGECKASRNKRAFSCDLLQPVRQHWGRGVKGDMRLYIRQACRELFFRSHRNDQRAPQSLVLGGGSDADMQGVALSMGADRSGRGRCALPQKMDVHVKRHEDKRTVGQMPHRLANADSEKGKWRE